MKYDLSKVPRPLHDHTLKCYSRVAVLGWDVVVENNDFAVAVARELSREEALEVVSEIRGVLKAHRLLAGKQTFTDLFLPT